MSVNPYKQTFDFLKMAEAIKTQSTGEKQKFTWINKMMDNLISSLENLKP